jgi:predicted permease
MFWDSLRGDIRHTLRLAIKTPVFTTLTIVALALGIGATTAIFAVVDGVLLRSLPYRDDARLVNVWSFNTRENRPRNEMSPANFLDFQKLNTTLDGLEGYFTFVTPKQMATESGTEIANSLQVTANMFNVLGRSAQLGRVFSENERDVVAVLSDGYWRRRFGADPNIIGKTLTLSGSAYEVVGVMPPDFVFPYPGMLAPSGFTRITGVDMWLPIPFSGPGAAANRMLAPNGQIVRGGHWWGAIGRMKPGVTPERVEADLKTIAAQLEQSYPATNKGWSATVVPSIDQSVGTIRPALLILITGIAFVLVMASVNVANLLLARSIARERELATRAALGAARARDRRRRGRTGRDVVDARQPDCTCSGRHSAHERSVDRLARAADRGNDHDAHRWSRWRVAGDELGRGQSAGKPSGCDPRQCRRRNAPPYSRGPRGRRNRARRRDHHGRGPAAP